MTSSVGCSNLERFGRQNLEETKKFQGHVKGIQLDRVLTALEALSLTNSQRAENALARAGECKALCQRLTIEQKELSSRL